VAGSWRRLHNEELCNLYALQVGEIGRACRMHGDMRNAYKIVVEKIYREEIN
jgi:hypothetical protein